MTYLKLSHAQGNYYGTKSQNRYELLNHLAAIDFFLAGTCELLGLLIRHGTNQRNAAGSDYLTAIVHIALVRA
jgi:hypothetical protein